MDKSLTEEVDIVEKRVSPFGKHAVLKLWNFFTGMSLLLPLIYFTYDRSTNNYDDDNNEADESYRKWRECNDEGGNWYKYWCSNGDDDNDQQNDEETYAPWWWRVRSEGEEHEDRYIVLTLLYLWTLAILAGLIYIVNQNYIQGKLKTVRWFLVGWCIYAVTISLLLGGIPQLIVEEVYDEEGDGQNLQEYGWYGQTSVLTFTTCVYELVTCTAFTFWIGYLLKRQQQNVEKEDFIDNPYAFF